MNEHNITKRKFASGRWHGLFWGLVLAAVGGFWLVSNLGNVAEPARIVIPGLIILWGAATLFTRHTDQ
jgi:apolipoprotein N-acyltransferase